MANFAPVHATKSTSPEGTGIDHRVTDLVLFISVRASVRVLLSYLGSLCSEFHRLSYGTGRPAILKDDESIWECRRLLQHPLAIEDDMRLVSTVELMAIRERIQNNIPLDGPVDAKAFQVLANADQEFQNWYVTWDNAFSQKYEDAGNYLFFGSRNNVNLTLVSIAFYRQSLQIQHLHAELFHNANALRDINHPDDVSRSPPAQRKLALKSIRIAQQVLDITINSPAYKEGMKYGTEDFTYGLHHY